MSRSLAKTLVLLSILAFLTSLAYLHLGSVSVSLADLTYCISHSSDIRCKILLDVRLPRLLGAMLGGAALSVSGLLLQCLFRNPIVGPWVLGIESGVMLFVAVAIITHHLFGAVSLVSPWSLLGAGVVGAVIVTVIMLIVASIVRSVVTVLLIGIMISYICGAIVDFLKVFAESEQIHALAMWVMGTFSLITWRQLEVMAPVVLSVLAVTSLLAKPLNAFLLGEDYAKSLGVNIRLTRVCTILCASLLTAAVVVFTGPVAFIGLAVPHIARLLLQTSDIRKLLPTVVVLGSLITTLCDLCARVIMKPVELPISAVTSLLGAPIVIFLLLKRRSEYA